MWRSNQRAHTIFSGYFAVLFSFCFLCSCCISASADGPSGRRIEMVSPVYKGGFGATRIEGVGGNGDALAFYSPGAFNGAAAGLSNNIDSLDYLARRGASNWETVPLMPPDSLMPSVDSHDISPSLAENLAVGDFGPNVEEANTESPDAAFLLHSTEMPDADANWELLGETVLKTLTNASFLPIYEGASPDFCHLFLVNGTGGTEEKNELLLAAKGTLKQVYELNRGCNGEPAGLRLVALDNKEKVLSPLCESELGTFHYTPTSANAYNAIAADGDELFFTTCVGNNDADHQLFVRLGGTKTIEISRPLDQKLEACNEASLPCPGAVSRASADFAGASEDGSRVFFTTSAALNSEDKDKNEDKEKDVDLYMAVLGCPSTEECPISERHVTKLVQVSHDPNGAEAGVQGVVRVAPDGSHVYFVATGDLLDAGAQSTLVEQGRTVPQVGADNLYVYNSDTGATTFVVDLCSGYELSGTTSDIQCSSKLGVDTSIWLRLSGGEAQTAGTNGNLLIFTSYGRLTADDRDSARDVYRYDAETEALIRVSIGENGYDANGNNDEFDASIMSGHQGGTVQSQYELDNRAASQDGARIVFTTAEPLSPAATNGLSNVYEWHEISSGQGEVSLISGGAAETPIEDTVISPEGNDVFFVTTEGLVAQDVDGAPDIYDARINGGFPVPSVPPESCAGDACQGPLTNPAPLLVPATASQSPEGTVSTSKKKVAKKTKKKVKKKTKKKKSGSSNAALRKAKRAARDDKRRAVPKYEGVR